ncbi:MAG: hypothetical protein ACYS5V_17790 [Planctomycetota bacterium]
MTGTADEVAGLTGLAGKEARRRVLIAEEAREVGARGLADLRNKIDDAYEVAFDSATGRQKKALYRDIASEGDAVATHQAAQSIFGEGIPIQRDPMTGQVLAAEGLQPTGILSELDEIIKSSDEFGFTRFWRDAQKSAVKARREIDDLGKLNRKMSRKRDPSGAEMASLERGKSMYEAVRQPLEDARLFGKRAAETQVKVNKRWVQHLEDVRRRPDHRDAESGCGPQGIPALHRRPGLRR